MKKGYLKRILAITLAVVTICFCFVGCKHEHTWVEATCTRPKICSECGETEGAPLGHTTKFGKCERCGKFIGESIVNAINDEITLIYSNCTTISNKFTSCPSYDSDYLYSVFSTNGPIYDDIENSLNKIIGLCDGIPELANIKSKAQAALNNIPSNLISSDFWSVMDYIDEQSAFEDFFDQLKDAYRDFENSIGK